MVEKELTPEILDNYIGIASWVDSKIAPPKKPRLSKNFDIFDILPDKMDSKRYRQEKVKVIPSAKQLMIYELILNIMLKTTDKYRDLIYLRNFPKKKSFRDLKYFFIGDSHETIRTNYNSALFDICRMVNKVGLDKFY